MAGARAEPDEPEAGVYDVDIPREWWVKAVPLLKLTSTLIKPFLGVGFAATELGFDAEQLDAVEKQLALVKETLTAAADLAGTADAGGSWTGEDAERTTQTGDDIVRGEGGVLRTLHALLAKEDPTFADLRWVTDQTGRYLWCIGATCRPTSHSCLTSRPDRGHVARCPTARARRTVFCTEVRD
jgi:hypothetical protein